jgi:hypothetical protein
MRLFILSAHDLPFRYGPYRYGGRKNDQIRSVVGGNTHKIKGMKGHFKMKQIMLHGENDWRLDDIDAPTPGPRDALVRIAACGIC